MNEIIDIHRTIKILTGKPPRIRNRKHVPLCSQRTERRVVVVRGDVIVNCDNFRDILVAVVGVVSSFAKTTEDKPYKRASCNGLSRIPDINVAVVVCEVQVAIVDEALGVSMGLESQAVHDDGGFF